MTPKIDKSRRKEELEKARLVTILDGSDVRIPPRRKLFILSEKEIESLILGTIVSQFLTFIGGVLINIRSSMVLTQNILIPTELIGVIISMLGFVSWILAVLRKLNQWKQEAKEISAQI